jgi:hypothetical protein
MNSIKGLVQIVPYLPPVVSGVGDHAYLLAGQLLAKHEVETRFLVANRFDPEGAATAVEFLSSPTARDLHVALAKYAAHATPVLLHYVGYGYQKRGAPVWLLRGVESWLRKGAGRRLAVFFHELYAFGPPWRSSFWLSPLQRWICARLATISDVRFTNREASAKILQAMSPRHPGKIAVWPVLSNFGEPHRVFPLHGRLPQLVLYGSVCRDKEELRDTVLKLKEYCAQLGIQRIISFGSTPPVGIDFLPTEHRGILPADEASSLLRQSRVGYLDYDARFLGKSSIFAAYCAHGILPILRHCCTPCTDGLKPGIHFLAGDDLPLGISVAAAEEIALAARAWYTQHSLSVTSEAMVNAIQKAEHE